MTYSIIIPVHNEQDSIIHTIQQCLTLEGLSELILVNDGSTDNTAKAMGSIVDEKLKIITNHKNCGYGYSLKKGIQQAQNEIVVITDADATYPNERIPELVSQINDYDMVVGARLGKHSRIPSIRRFPKWLLRKLANYLAESDIPDLNSGLRVMKKSIVQKYYRILPDGFSFTTTITLAMLTNNYQVSYLPIDYFGRTGRSKIRPVYDTLNFVQLIIRTIVYFKPFKIFFNLALLSVISAFMVLILGLWLRGRIYDATISVLFISSIQLLGIGLIADLIQKRTQFNE